MTQEELWGGAHARRPRVIRWLVLLVLVLVVGAGMACWFVGKPAWEKASAEEAAQRYVQLVFEGKYEEAEEYARPAFPGCSDLHCTLDASMAQPIEYPQLIDLSLENEHNSDYMVTVRYTVAGSEQTGVFSVAQARGYVSASDKRQMGAWVIETPLMVRTRATLDKAISSLTVGEQSVYDAPTGGNGRPYPCASVTISGYPGLYDIHLTKMSERWYQELWGSDDTLIDSGDFDHVTVALGDDFGIRVVATPEDYDEVHADIESMIRQCLRGEDSWVCDSRLRGKGEDGVTISMRDDVRFEFTRAALENNWVNVTVSFPDGTDENVTVTWVYVLHYRDPVTITYKVTS